MDEVYVHISGLKRPFTVASIKELLLKYGNIKYFWLNNIRSDCIVSYDSISSAQTCISNINGLKWPQAIGQTLSANILSSNLEAENLKSTIINRNPNQVDKRRKEKDSEMKHENEKLSFIPLISPHKPSLDERRKPSGTSLEELFIKTKTQPHLYYKLAIEDY